jgi:hypothetical protein
MELEDSTPSVFETAKSETERYASSQRIASGCAVVRAQDSQFISLLLFLEAYNPPYPCP